MALPFSILAKSTTSSKWSSKLSPYLVFNLLIAASSKELKFCSGYKASKSKASWSTVLASAGRPNSNSNSSKFLFSFTAFAL